MDEDGESKWRNLERKFGSVRNVCSRCGQCAADPNKMPSKVGSLGNPLEDPDVCSGRRTETYRAQMWAGPVTSSERRVMWLGSVYWVTNVWLVCACAGRIAHHVRAAHARYNFF